MTKVSGTMWKCIFLIMILAIAGAAAIPSMGEEILLHTQQPYRISDNRTLVAEDVDPSAGVVWLKLYGGNETLKSALLGVGDHFVYDRMNLTVSKIYAGGEMDLVEIVSNNSSAVDRSGYLPPFSANISVNSSDSASLNLTLNTTYPSRNSERSPALKQGLPQ